MLTIPIKASPTLGAFARAWRHLRIEHRLIRLDNMRDQIDKDLEFERQWLEQMETNSRVQKREISRERRHLLDELTNTTKGDF